MVPTFDKDGNAFTGSGSTFHGSGVILHPLQKAGVIPLKGLTWVSRIGSLASHFVHNMAKIPGEGSGEEFR